MDTTLDFQQTASDRAREQAERLLACFQQALGHELPNQLVAIQGLARVLEMELGDRVDDEARGHLLRLAALARRTDEFIRALAQVGRWCREPGPVMPAALFEIAREAAAEVNLIFPGLVIEYDGLSNLPGSAAPRRAVYRVLVQLLRNAAGAAAVDRALRITVGGRIVAPGIEMWVSDNGVGITPEKQARLFEPFAGDRTAGGAGLGLFLVRQLVAGWGGSVRVQSEPGQGTTVTLLVPGP